MKNHGFPCANPYLDMKEKRDAYMKHLKALRTPRHIIDDTQPETPSRLITRKNRYIEMQRMIMKTGDENIKLISNCNQRDIKNNCLKNYCNSPSRPPSSNIISPKSVSRNEKARTPNSQKRKQQVLMNDDWISNVATELASLPSTNFANKAHKSDEKRKEDLPPLSQKTEVEENSQNNTPIKKEEEPFYTTEDTTLGDAGYKARLESMVNEINGILD